MAYKDVKAIFRTDFLTRITSIADANIFKDNTFATVKDNAVWCQLSVNTGESANKTIVSGVGIRKVYPGLMTVKVFDPTGAGSTDIEVAIQEIIEDYSNLNLAVGDTEGTTIKFRAAYETRVGRMGGQYQSNVNCPFSFDLT